MKKRILALLLALTLLVLGGITTITEWKNIRTSPVKKIVYMFTFPLFMFTYIPISLAAFFCKPQWKPIEHHRADQRVLETAAAGRNK